MTDSVIPEDFLTGNFSADSQDFPFSNDLEPCQQNIENTNATRTPSLVIPQLNLSKVNTTQPGHRRKVTPIWQKLEEMTENDS